MTSVALTSDELAKIAGPLLIAHLLNWGLFGVLSLQVYMYYLAFPKDRSVYKVLVSVTYLLEVAQTFLATESAFKTFAFGFGNPAVLDEVGVLWFSAPLMSGMSAFLSQSFYAYRIYVLAQSYHFSGMIMLLASFSLAGCIALSVETKKAVLFSRLLVKGTFTSAAIWESGGAACDVLIAASMIYYLKKRDTGIKQTQVLLAKIIRLTIETGTLTAALAIVSLILTFLPGGPTYYQTSVSVLGKVYTNSMLVAFNSRMKIGGSSNSTSTLTEVHELPTVSHGTRKHGDVELGRMRTGGVLVTREEVSFSSPSGDVLQDNKRSSDDF